jgi:hypothetical protein
MDRLAALRAHLQPLHPSPPPPQQQEVSAQATTVAANPLAYTASNPASIIHALNESGCAFLEGVLSPAQAAHLSKVLANLQVSPLAVVRQFVVVGTFTGMNSVAVCVYSNLCSRDTRLR